MSGPGVEFPAREIAARVRSGEMTAEDVARVHLDRVRDRDEAIGAFQHLERRRVLDEARVVDDRDDRTKLPLAGVPVPVKDNVDAEGHPTRHGSRATSTASAKVDHPVVARLRAAGAVILGKTRLPELGVWGTTDSAFGVTRSPADPSRTAGGSSGGSAAAVAAGMCHVAHGNDGLGSIRIPAACCGVFGIKPGAGVVPAAIGEDSWSGLAENGPLAGSVADGALALSVMAGRPEWRDIAVPGRSLSIAVSSEIPLPGLSPDPALAEAVRAVGDHLADGGHRVEQADPPHPTRAVMAILARWFDGARSGAEGLDLRRLEPRTRTHVRIGRLVRRTGAPRPGARTWWRRKLAPFFRSHDLLLTPTLAAPPPPADEWHRRSWAANVWSNLRFAPYTAPWNLAGYPAASVPLARRDDGVPASVQLVAPPGGEGLVLSVARQIESASIAPR